MLRLELELEILFRIVPGIPEDVNRYSDCNQANMLAWCVSRNVVQLMGAQRVIGGLSPDKNS